MLYDSSVFDSPSICNALFSLPHLDKVMSCSRLPNLVFRVVELSKRGNRSKKYFTPRILSTTSLSQLKFGQNSTLLKLLKFNFSNM